MKKTPLSTLFFCLFALLSTQELQAAPYIYSHTAHTSASPTSQLLGTRTYNAMGQRVSEGDSNGQLTHYTYSSTGQLATTQDRNGHVVHKIYNDHAQLSTSWADQTPTSTTPGADATGTVGMHYDTGSDQLTSSTYQQNHAATTQTTRDQYNLAGNLSTKTYNNGKTQTYHYNLNGSTKSFTNVLNQTTQYSYTPMKQLNTVMLNGDTTTYTYDPFGRLLNEARQNGLQTHWT